MKRRILIIAAILCCIGLTTQAQTGGKYNWIKLTQTDPYTTYILDKNGQIQAYAGTGLHTGVVNSSVNINCPEIPEDAESLQDVSEHISYTNMYGETACDTTKADALEQFNEALSFMDSYKTDLMNAFSIYRGGQYTFRNTLPGIGYDYSKVVDILDEPSVRVKGGSVQVGEDINVEVIFNTGYPYEASQFTGNEKAKLTLYYNPVGVEELTEVASTEKQLALCRTDQPLVAAVDTIRMKVEKPAVGRYVVRISSDWNFEDANTQIFLTVKDTVVTCTNGNIEYASIQDAINEVGENDTIKVAKDVALRSTIQVPADAPAFTLDLNGHVLSGDSIPAPTAGGELGNIIQNLGTLTIIDSDSLAMHTDSLSTMKGGILTGGKGGCNFYGYDDTGAPQYWSKPAGGAIFNRGKLTMTGGTIYRNTAVSGGGITNDIDGKTYLKGCIVSDNFASDAGGGVLAFDGYVNLENCTVHNNSAKQGAGISNAYGKTDIANCSVYANSGKYGGGITNETGETTITDCTIRENTGTSLAGGVYNYDGKTTVRNCVVEGNFSKNGAGIYVREDTLAVIGCDVSENNASSYGGGMYVRKGYVSLQDCNFHDNSYQYGGGIYQLDGTVDMTDCHFDNNKDGEQGGGIGVYDGTANIKNCTIVGNTVNDSGGGIGIRQGKITMTGCTVNGNSAIYGAGLYALNDTLVMVGCEIAQNNASDAGGGMYVNEGYVSMQDCNLHDNSYEYGGGIYQLNGTVDMTDCHLDNNKDGEQGGGINVYDGTANITNCTIKGNSVNYYGGGIRSGQGTVNVTGCIIDGNSAEFGGGLADYNGQVNMKDCSFTSNSASVAGGAIEASGREILEDCTLTGNAFAGIFVWPTDSTSYLVLKGKTVIKDNTVDGVPFNVFCQSNEAYPARITLDGLAEGSEIGVCAVMDSIVGTTYQFATNGTADDLKYFTADEKGYLVQYNAAGYLELLAANTGVDTVGTPASDDADTPVYDLQGRRMPAGTVKKGIYIKGGKKILF